MKNKQKKLVQESSRFIRRRGSSRRPCAPILNEKIIIKTNEKKSNGHADDEVFYQEEGDRNRVTLLRLMYLHRSIWLALYLWDVGHHSLIHGWHRDHSRDTDWIRCCQKKKKINKSFLIQIKKISRQEKNNITVLVCDLVFSTLNRWMNSTVLTLTIFTSEKDVVLSFLTDGRLGDCRQVNGGDCCAVSRVG